MPYEDRPPQKKKISIICDCVQYFMFLHVFKKILIYFLHCFIENIDDKACNCFQKTIPFIMKLEI